MAQLRAKKIISDPAILGGKPILLGTRLSVEFVLELIGSGMTFDDITEEYPTLSAADIAAALNFAQRAVSHERVVPLGVR